MAFPGLLNYWFVVVLMMIGFFIVIAHGNLVKKIVGLNVFAIWVMKPKFLKAASWFY